MKIDLILLKFNIIQTYKYFKIKMIKLMKFRFLIRILQYLEN